MSFLVKSNINLTGVIWGLYKDVFTIISAEENEALDNVWQNKPVFLLQPRKSSLTAIGVCKNA